jgi:excisionase family DNA binding protein
MAPSGSASEQSVLAAQAAHSRDAQQGFEPRIGRSVSLDHAAELLGVSRRTVYNRIRDGRLHTVRTLGGSQRVLVDSVEGEFRAGRPIPSVRRGPDV